MVFRGFVIGKTLVPVARQVRSDVKLITGTGNEFLLGTGHIDTLLKGGAM